MSDAPENAVAEPDAGGVWECCGAAAGAAHLSDCSRAAGIVPVEEDGASALERLENERDEAEKAQRLALTKEFGNFGFIVMPGEAEPPILGQQLRLVLHQWLFEMNAADALATAGLLPRQRALLSGPPGCGKTTLAHHIAARLGIPMVVVQAHVLKSKWVSESGERIGKLFRAARRDSHGIALFFDEFDSIAMNREEMGGSGGDREMSSVVNAFLQEMDRYEGLLFAATNQADKIDRAIWRRFQMQVEIGLPGRVEREAIVRLYMRPFVCDEAVVEFLAMLLEGGSPALIKECCETLKRGLVLGPLMQLSTALPDLLRRLMLTVAPPPEVEPPKLWTAASSRIGESAKLAWPPVTGANC